MPAWPALSQGARRRIGYLGAGTEKNDAPWLAAFHAGMAELGWVEGRDYVLESLFANVRMQDLPRLAGELVASRPDLLLTPTENTLAPILDKTRSIPVVVVLATDPVGSGYAETLPRPGGSVTGLTSLARDLAGKRLQILKEGFPSISHVAILYEPHVKTAGAQIKEIEAAAVRLKIKVTAFSLVGQADVESLARRTGEIGVDGYIGTTGAIQTTQRTAINRQITRLRKPAIFTAPLHAESGGLMSYGVSSQDNFRRAAAYVDKILKGAKPGELPIQEPSKYELVVNLRTAKALGIAMLPAILARADRIVE